MKEKTKSKSNSLKRSLKILKGGEDAEPKEEKKSSFFDFLNKRDIKKTEEPSSLSNGADTENDKDASITIKSNKILSILSPNETASISSSNGEAPASTSWFIFRVVVVLLIVLAFILNLTGHLDSVVEEFKAFYDKNIAPLLVSIGLIKDTPIVAEKKGDSLPGNASNTGTNTISQLEKNVGKENIDNNRMEQELIYYMEKIDIHEEQIRLRQHCEYFKTILNESEEGKGKKLSFILQEIGREINTTGSKAYDADIQKCVVKMKDELEKAKEQVLNAL